MIKTIDSIHTLFAHRKGVGRLVHTLRTYRGMALWENNPIGLWVMVFYSLRDAIIMIAKVFGRYTSIQLYCSPLYLMVAVRYIFFFSN